MTRAEQIYGFIQKETAEGKTVFLQTHLIVTPVKSKNLSAVKLSANKKSILIQRGKKWIDYTFVSRVYSEK